MTAPAFRSAGTIVSTAVNGTDITPGAPAGATNNDILILIAAGVVDDLPGSPTNQLNLAANGTGWTEIQEFFVDVGTNAINIRAWWYRVSGSPPTMPSVDHADIDNQIAAQVFAYSGCITTGTPWEDADSTGNASQTSLPGVAVTTSGPDRLVVEFFFENDDRTSAPDTGWTENSESTIAGPPDVAIFADSIVKASAGTQTAPTRTIALAEDYAVIGFALLPPAGAGPTAAQLSGFMPFFEAA